MTESEESDASTDGSSTSKGPNKLKSESKGPKSKKSTFIHSKPSLKTDLRVRDAVIAKAVDLLHSPACDSFLLDAQLPSDNSDINRVMTVKKDSLASPHHLVPSLCYFSAILVVLVVSRLFSDHDAHGTV